MHCVFDPTMRKKAPSRQAEPALSGKTSAKPREASGHARSVAAGPVWLWPILFGSLALLIAGMYRQPIAVSQAHINVLYNEGWNAYRQDMAANGIPIYGEPPGYLEANYPPLSFHIIGLLGSLSGDM